VLIKGEHALRKRLRALLARVLSPNELAYICNSYNIIGDIAVIRVSERAKKYGRIIAEAIMQVHKNVGTVLAQTSPIRGGFRLRRLELVAGEAKAVTIHRESGCLFSVDLEKCYFSPRLVYERMRVARLSKREETVVNMFAGVGCFSVVMAKHSNVGRVYSIDTNPTAIHYMKENIGLNRVYGRVIPVQGDAKEVIEKRLRHVADRVLMPLPEKALEYLPYALLTLRNQAERWVHYYDFEHANKRENPAEKVKLKVAERLKGLGVAFEVPSSRIIRTTGPNWYQIVLDINIAQ
jgi:tRNA (guanine37-N1)-methyltransferase